MTKKTKKTKRKQKQRRIYLTFAFSERHVTASRHGDREAEHMIMLYVTLRRFDQSAKQLIVTHTTAFVCCYAGHE